MIDQKMKCSGTWTYFRLPAMPLDSPSAQSKRRSCFSQHPTQFKLLRSNHHSEGPEAENEDKFTYLGSTLSRNVLIDDEAGAKIAKVSTTFGRLRKNMWERQGLNLQTKLKVYKAVVMTTLLYACDIWTVYCRHARKLNILYINCLRRLLLLAKYGERSGRRSTTAIRTP